MNEFWNARYAREEYVYGTEPNAFFKQEIDKLPGMGSILLPAEGEGRNAVYAASRGWQVTAVDYSIEGRKKAMALASKKNVEIDYLIKDLGHLAMDENSFEVLAMIYVHPTPAQRSEINQKLASYVKPGGHLIMEVFSKGHQKFQEKNPSAGGPKDPDMLYSEEEVLKDFPDFDIISIQDTVVELYEGEFHKGESAVIRFTGVKK
jgi:SAM-dependent methyltransferase